jgi:replicative DNA helicase
MDLKTSVFLENEFIDRLNFININPLAEKMQLALSKLANNDFINYHSIIQEVNSISGKINKSVLSNSVVSVTLPDITFQNNDEFKTSIGRARRYLNNDKRVIKTGIKRLNRFLNGGFEPGRVYTVNGISGGGKSVILLLIAIWALKYNKDIVCNDMIRKPCLIYYTQENDVEETLDRIFSYIEGRDEKGKIRDENDLIQLLTEHGILDDRWVLKIKYRPKNTISTMDIDNDISEIEAEGDLEVKMIVHDYLKRFKPDNPIGDIRVDMGEAN